MPDLPELTMRQPDTRLEAADTLYHHLAYQLGWHPRLQRLAEWIGRPICAAYERTLIAPARSEAPHA